MSSAKQGTTLILASVAVCLLVYVLKQEFKQPRARSVAQEIVGTVRNALGSSGGARTRCSNINPGHADWARCAQGSSVGRVPTKNASGVVKNSTLNFVSDSLNHQGLGVGRLQDDFVNDQYSSSLGVPRLGGMKINKSSSQKDGFFSAGRAQDATKLVTSGISSEGAAAFPFMRKSGPERGEESEFSPSGNSSGEVPGTEPVGMGMKFSDFKQHTRGREHDGGGGGRSPLRSQVNKKLGVAPFEDQGAEFNPFLGTNPSGHGSGLKLNEAFDTPKLGMGTKLNKAFGALGAAVSPISSSDVGVSPIEISAATAALDDVNIVQSMPTGHIDRFIRP